MAKQVLVTGATGAVGPRVVNALHEAGYTIRTLSIDPPKAGIFPESVEVRIGDVTDASAVRSAIQSVEAVIHLAALLHINNPPANLRERYERINVGGTAMVLQAAAQADVKRLIFFSTIAVYGESAGQVLTEDSPPCPDSFYAQTKLAAEQLVLNARRADGQCLGTVLRLGAVYGSQIKGNYQRLLQSLANGHFIPIGAGRNRRTLIYDKDVANAVVLAIGHPAAAGELYNVTDGQFHAMNEIIRAMCGALGRTPPRVSMPAGPVRLAAGLVEDGMRLVGRESRITRATVDKYVEDATVSGQRIQTQLGFRPKFDLASGWLETVQEMRRAGEL